MENQNTLKPLLSEQGLLWIGSGILVLLIAAGICFTIIFLKHDDGLQNFKGGNSLHFFTITVVAFSTFILGLERILSGEAVAGILGGIVGYVLGGLKNKEDIKGSHTH